jgi:hypothetical protein
MERGNLARSTRLNPKLPRTAPEESMICGKFSGEKRAEFGAHYHCERNHQGKGNKLLFRMRAINPKARPLSVECRHRLEGLRKYYRRAA